MEHALRDVPILELAPPEGVVQAGIDWMYSEHAKDGGVLSLGLDEMPVVSTAPPKDVPVATPAPVPAPATPASAPAAEERLKILDLFKY
jgi:penicillin-binding protein 1A